jgi:hypothetical protein
MRKDLKLTGGAPMRKDIRDEVFGKLRWDKQLGWWGTKLELPPKNRIAVFITNDDTDIGKLLETSKKAFLAIKKDERRLREGAAAKLLKLHNKTWNEGKPITKEQFISKMRLESLGFYIGGIAEAYYNDGDLFWGHSISVSISKSGKITDAGIEG